MLVDAFGREVTDIRVSVTKRCNFGCIYCHDEGLGPILKPRMPHEDEMSVAEIERLLRVAREFGIRSVKFTGGEPLVPRMIEYISDGDGLKLQLIQFMPELVGQQNWMVDIDRLKKWLERRADKVLVREMHHRRIYLFNGAEVEVVDPVYNAEFCMNCHRIRVTHQGELKGCLNRNDDLIPTRSLDDDGLRQAFRQVVANRVPYYGAYVKDFPRRDPHAALPIEFPTVSSAAAG